MGRNSYLLVALAICSLWVLAKVGQSDEDVALRANSQGTTRIGNVKKSHSPCYTQDDKLKETRLDNGDFAACSELQHCFMREALPSPAVVVEATACPESDRWLDEYLEEQRLASTTQNFLALYFGCNKGFDALHTAAVISRDVSVFGKRHWAEATGANSGICGQGSGDDEDFHKRDKGRPVEVHCVEALPQTARILTKGAEATRADQHGLKVHNYAIVGTPGVGSILFPDGADFFGEEGFSLAHCAREEFRDKCVETPAATIDEYVDKHVALTEGETIPYLSIDIEGFDYTAMKAATNTLQRTNYLEFEYHGQGDWLDQNLKDAIDMLSGHGLVCYWSGRSQLYRITNCWLDYFDFHSWSNVACVSPQRQPKLAAKMEAVFRSSLLEHTNKVHHDTSAFDFPK